MTNVLSSTDPTLMSMNLKNSDSIQEARLSETWIALLPLIVTDQSVGIVSLVHRIRVAVELLTLSSSGIDVH